MSYVRCWEPDAWTVILKTSSGIRAGWSGFNNMSQSLYLIHWKNCLHCYCSLAHRCSRSRGWCFWMKTSIFDWLTGLIPNNKLLKRTMNQTWSWISRLTVISAPAASSGCCFDLLLLLLLLSESVCCCFFEAAVRDLGSEWKNVSLQCDSEPCDSRWGRGEGGRGDNSHQH